MTHPNPHAHPQGGILRRAVRNAGLLLGGKTAGGIMQLGTFALAARGLGVEQFGIFSVVVAQVMLLTGIAAFDSNQAIIRYGVPHMNAAKLPAIQALFKAGTLLDFVAALLAGIAAVALAPFFGARMGWNADLILLSQLAAPLALANAVATPKAMLRLFNRFDLLTVQAVVTPAVRLALVAVLALTGASLGWYIGVWVVAGWAGTAAGLFFGWREARRRGVLAGLDLSLKRLSDENPGMWRFAIVSNLNSSVGLVPTQLAVVLVGWLLGPSAAGIFRIVREVGTGMMKPIDLMNQALYPDLARLIAARAWDRLRRAAVRAGLAASGVGLLVSVLIWLIGGTIVGTVFGDDFRAAAPVLVAVGLGTTIRVLAFPADPIMYALGRPSVPLMLAIVSALLFVGLMLWRLPIDGLIGAGWAFVGMGAMQALLSSIAAVRMLRRERAIVEEAAA